MLAGLLLYSFEQASEVLKFFREFARTAPDALTLIGGFLTAPEGVPVFAVAVCHNGPVEEGERVLQPLRQFGSPLADHIAPMGYRQLQTMLDPALPPGRQNYVKANYLEEIADEGIDILAQGFSSVPSPYTMVLLVKLGGAVSRTPKEDTAFYYRDAGYHFEILSSWEDPGEGESNIQWTRKLWREMRPFSSSGIYINQMIGDEGEGQVSTGYGDNYPRLLALKKKYDPDNLFRHNQNIRPTVG